MSQWNLSVRLTGQGSDLASTLRTSARQADSLTRSINRSRRALDGLRRDAAHDVRIHLALDAGDLRRDVRDALTAAGSGQGMRVRLGLDAAGLRTDVQAALTAASSGQGVQLRLANTMQLRRDVTAAVRWAAWGQAIDVPLRLADAMQLRRDVSAAVRWASTEQTVRVRVAADTSALDNLNTRAGGAGSGAGTGSRNALRGLLLLAPAALPLISGLSTALAPLPGMFAAASVPAAAFGAAVAGQAGPLMEAADAEKKYTEAVAEHGRTSEQALEAQRAYQQRLSAMPEATQQASIALSGLKRNFTDWSDSMAEFTMAPVTHGITVLDTLLPQLTRHTQTGAAQLDRLITVAGGAIQTPGFDAMAARFADFTDTQLTTMTTKVIRFMQMLSEGEGLQSGPIAEFMAYAQENGPAAREALDAIGRALVTLMRAAAEAGPGMLTVVTAAANLVAALPPELVGIILQVATALKLLQLTGAGMAVVGTALAAVRTQIVAAGTAAAGATGGVASLRAGFAALGATVRGSIIVAALAAAAMTISKLSEQAKGAPPDVDRLTTSLLRLAEAGQFTGELESTFGNIDGLVDKVNKLNDAQDRFNKSSYGVRIPVWDDMMDSLAKPIDNIVRGSDSFEALADDFKSVDSAMAGMVQSGHATQAADDFDLISSALRKAGHSTKDINRLFPEYVKQTEALAAEQELAASGMGLFGQAALDTKTKLDAQKQSADGLRQSIQALNDVNRAAGGAMNAFEGAIDQAAEAAKAHAGALAMSNGELDLGSQGARDAESALRDLASKTDEAATAARQQGKSWSDVKGIYDKGRKSFTDTAQAMGLTKDQAEALARSYLKIPDFKTLKLQMRTEDAVASLDAVIDAIQKTPDAKKVTVEALTDDAVAMLESLGYTVKEMKDGRFTVTAETGSASQELANVQAARDGLKDKTLKLNADELDAIRGLQMVADKIQATPGAKSVTITGLPQSAIRALEDVGYRVRVLPNGKVVVTAANGQALSGIRAVQGARDRLSDKSITITTVRRTVMETIRSGPSDTADALRRQADSFRRADGGTVDYYAAGGLRDRPGSENHTAQIAPAGSWRVWAEPETGGEGYVPFAASKRPRSRVITEEIVRRLGGDPDGIAWNANGSVTDWRYDPTSGSLYSSSDAGRAGHRTKKVKTKVKGKWQTKEVEYFDIGAVEKKLRSASAATRAWNKDLEAVAHRAGTDVADALAAMGEDGRKLADKMANGSTKYLNDMAKALRDLQKTAYASLTDYTRQLTGANKVSRTFTDNLAKLAARGYGDLASQLAAQGDTAAQQLAATAVKDNGRARTANSAAKTANSALTGDQVEQLVAIIAAVRTSKTGIHDVAATTGLGEDDIIAVANRATSQIKTSLGSRASRFLTDLTKANKGLAYANGGIRSGIYATQAGAVTFAEPSTGGEAYIPLGAAKRRHAMPVLADVAGRFGYGLRDAAEGRVVIIREQGPLVGQQHWHIAAGGSQRDLTARIDSDNAYQLRRLARGGTGARR